MSVINTKSSRVSISSNRDKRLLAEVSHKCPLCGKVLIIESNGKQVNFYENAHIYPHSPTPEDLEILRDITPPQDIESINNLIPLCKNCHTKYDKSKTLEMYLQLSEIKRKKSLLFELNTELFDVNIENDLLKVLKELDNMPIDDISKLRLDPIPVKKKIAPGAFQNKVFSNAMQFYPYLRFQFQDMDSRHTHQFAKIANEVNLAYLKASSDTFLREEVFDLLVEWLISKTMGTRASCEVVISYFIYDCEVFDALP